MTAGERPDNRVVLWLSLVDEEESSWEVGLVERKSGVRSDWASSSRFSLVGGEEGERVPEELRLMEHHHRVSYMLQASTLCFNRFPLAF